jgi:hypothetical protein
VSSISLTNTLSLSFFPSLTLTHTLSLSLDSNSYSSSWGRTSELPWRIHHNNIKLSFFIQFLLFNKEKSQSQPKPNPISLSTHNHTHTHTHTITYRPIKVTHITSNWNTMWRNFKCFNLKFTFRTFF